MSAYPALNHPNPRKDGVAWGPREALGYDLPSRVAGLGSFPVQLAADLKT